MSETHLVQRDLSIRHVASLARHLGQHIAVYALETTGSRSEGNFGITEVVCIFVAPDGRVAKVASLVNPEVPVSGKATESNGITNEMVARCPNWKQHYAQMFYNMAAGECWVVGYNNEAFDNLAVQDMNEKYGLPIPVFSKTFDVYKLYLTLSKSVSGRGTLTQIARRYEVTLREGLFGAEAGAVLSIETLDALIGHFGTANIAALVSKHCQHPTPAKPIVKEPPKVVAPEEAPIPKVEAAPKRSLVPATKPVLQALVSFTADKEKVDIANLEKALAVDAKTLSFQIGKGIDERLLEPSKFANQRAQDTLYPALIDLDFDVLTQGKLKPIHDSLAPVVPADCLDYIQLRIALLNFGMPWATLKAA